MRASAALIYLAQHSTTDLLHKMRSFQTNESGKNTLITLQAFATYCVDITTAVSRTRQINIRSRLGGVTKALALSIEE